jgi:serine/threonine-protein kinase
VGGLLLEKKLGTGGYGTVYLARGSRRLHAMKFIFLPHHGKRAQRELDVMLGLPAGCGLPLEGHGYWPDESPCFLFLTMPYVPGRTLDRWVQESNPGAREATRKVLALARQLALAHRAGVLHRDVKPSNILVREPGGQLFLVDFGVGTFAGSEEAPGSMPPGSLPFLSPDSLRPVLQRAPYRPSPLDDLWALGVLLYWLLTGAYPFQARDAHALAQAILHHTPQAPHELNPRVPRPLGELCMRLLDKEASARFPNAEALCAALEALLQDAEGQPSWDEPLCEAWSPDTATTELSGWMDLEAMGAYLRRQEKYAHPPRRGAPPPAEEPPTPLPPTREQPLAPEDSSELPVDSANGPPLLAPPPAPEPAAPSPEPPAAATEASAPPPELPAPASEPPEARAASPQRPPPSLLLPAGLLALLAVLGLCWTLFFLLFPPVPSSPPAPPTQSVLPPRHDLSSHKLAPTPHPSEGSAGAAPARAPTPAPVAPATLPEAKPHVKTQPPPPAPQPQQKKSPPKEDPCSPSALAKACAIGATVCNLACPGPQVRPLPPAQDCPPEAIAAMKQFKLTHRRSGAQLVEGVTQTLTVREGPVEAFLVDSMGEVVTYETRLTGQLYIGPERVYVRLTQAHPAGQPPIPICAEVFSQGFERNPPLKLGIAKEPDSGKDSATLYNFVWVHMVDRFTQPER